MKRISLFFDGTWNTPKSKTNVTRLRQTANGETFFEEETLNFIESNVRRLYRLVSSQNSYEMQFGKLIDTGQTRGEGEQTESEWQQIKYYHNGVGTSSAFMDNVFGGPFGYGLSRNICDAYLWLAQQYEPGDQVFLFGFSRGAFTARSFAGLIKCCGILKNKDGSGNLLNQKGLESRRDRAYEIYSEGKFDESAAAAFRNQNSHPDPKIKFIGVWDTVGALGLGWPVVNRWRWIGRHNYSFHCTELNDIVEKAYHAMAIDEHREDFNVEPWTNCVSGQTLEQCWFVGSHSNVGGGYGGDLLSDISLKWMQDNARASKLQFIKTVRVDPDAICFPIIDSYKEFFGGIYSKFCDRYFRSRGTFNMDSSVNQRITNPNGFDEQKKRYTIRLKP